MSTHRLLFPRAPAPCDLGISGTDDNPAAISRTKGNIELFIRGRDNHLYRRAYTADADELNDNGGVTDPS
ncbi:hypothetical protein [Streptomyces sp. OE57]|uniref:hypothetical protein n=1 Tax=Streptomyces lacaronensis TaxID=3379885 RepID=UPI0039B76A8D